MLYRAARWKLADQDIPSLKLGLVSLSRRRTFTKRPVKVDTPVSTVDQRQVAFSHFTEIASIDRKRKNKPGCHLKKSNTFLAWFGRSATDSSDIVMSGCDSEMTKPTREALIKQVNSVDLITAMLKVLSLEDKRKLKESDKEHFVNSVDLITAMLKGLSLEDKRKLKESDKEHFETFQAHRPYARPYAKRMKVANN